MGVSCAIGFVSLAGLSGMPISKLPQIAPTNPAFFGEADCVSS